MGAINSSASSKIETNPILGRPWKVTYWTLVILKIIFRNLNQADELNGLDPIGIMFRTYQPSSTPLV